MNLSAQLPSDRDVNARVDAEADARRRIVASVGYVVAATALRALLADALISAPTGDARNFGAWLKLRVLDDRLRRTLPDAPEYREAPMSRAPAREHREFARADLVDALYQMDRPRAPYPPAAREAVIAALRLVGDWPASWPVAPKVAP